VGIPDDDSIVKPGAFCLSLAGTAAATADERSPESGWAVLVVGEKMSRKILL